jgi:hypothetical protein
VTIFLVVSKLQRQQQRIVIFEVLSEAPQNENDPLDEISRQEARRLLMEVLSLKVAEYIERKKNQVDAAGE